MQDVPKTMRAAAIDRFGPPSVLKVRKVPTPEPGPSEVLIALDAAGVGVWDTDIRSGWWPEGKPKFPLVPGTDGAGIIVAKGGRVRRLHIGDRVWAYEFINRKGGFYAEYVAVNAQHVSPVPRPLDMLHAGAAAVTGLTALQGIDDHLRVRRKETVLIFGATGAVGTLAVQFAKRRRAKVVATASGRDAEKIVWGLAPTEFSILAAMTRPASFKSWRPMALMPCSRSLAVKRWSDVSRRYAKADVSHIQME